MKVLDSEEKRLYTALYLQHGISDQSLEQCRNYSARGERKRQRVSYKRPYQADQCLCYNAIFHFTADLAQAYTQSFCIILPLPPGRE